ncbi:outer membrane beta-barrel protein [Pedobacter metabolipauper]|uniref:Carboxypeptidase family protein n=1 Tax=Pedobacter metabolipauper TaxID=425513 RepID=A0A4R6SSJ4_9SPHI|nr:outer membrane beta-barrel protein [Pedobacter metabolipauper]TDQ07518.1 carboxypeptidase family protein [Pedobacter metabolipauper]
MNKFFVSLLLSMAAFTSFAQNKATIKGILIDSASKAPVEYATVAVVNTKDTTLISYTLSDKKGAFTISGITTERPTRLIVSYVGYKIIRRNLDLTKGETKDMGTLLFTSESLQEVVIQGARSPIVVKKDTIEFNTEAFKTRPNAVVEELLRKLPGVQVNTDGSILVNGKSISKLLIDGKQFFGNDPKVATRNLDADMIDKIQVYDDRENDPDHKLSETQVVKIINLKLKNKIKKSTMGKIFGGGGTRDRYEFGGIVSSFRDTLQVSLIGLGNNLNKTGFSSQELYSMGGFNRSGGSQIYDGTFGGRGWGGIEKVASGGVNINNDYGQKLKMNLTYFYTNTIRNNDGSAYGEQTLPETILYTTANYGSKNTENKHALSSSIEWRPDTLNRFKYEPRLNLNGNKSDDRSYNLSSNTLNPILSESKGYSNSNSDNTDFSHNFSWYRRLKKKGSSLNINHNLSLNNSASNNFNFNDLVSYTSQLKSETLDRYANGANGGDNASLSIGYTYPIVKKLTAELNASSGYSASSEGLFTYDKNVTTGLYDIFLNNQSNELDRTTWTHDLTPQLAYQITEKYNLRLGVNAKWQNLNNKFGGNTGDVKKQYSNVFPIVRFDGPGFSINYAENIQQPGISQIQPIVREYSQLYKYTGNPDLEPTHQYEINGNVYKYNYKNQTNLNAYASVRFSDNEIIQRTNIEANGAHTSTYINRNGGIYGYVSASFGKQFKKSQDWQIGLNTNVNLNINKSAFFLNADEGLQYRYSASAGEGINFNYNELLSLSSNYNFSKSITNYKNVDFKSVNTYTHTLGADMSLRWPKRVIVEGNYNFNYNPQVSQGFQKSSNILNLAVSIQMLKKDRGNLKVSVYDILDENVSVYQYASNNSISMGQQDVLKRYFLVTYQYKFNIYKSK